MPVTPGRLSTRTGSSKVVAIRTLLLLVALQGCASDSRQVAPAQGGLKSTVCTAVRQDPGTHTPKHASAELVVFNRESGQLLGTAIVSASIELAAGYYGFRQGCIAFIVASPMIAASAEVELIREGDGQTKGTVDYFKVHVRVIGPHAVENGRHLNPPFKDETWNIGVSADGIHVYPVLHPPRTGWNGYDFDIRATAETYAFD